MSKRSINGVDRENPQDIGCQNLSIYYIMDNVEMKMAALSVFPTIFRYIVLIGLYVLLFTQFKNNSLQFILFIVAFVLNFFSLVFVARDMLFTRQLMKNIYGLYSEGDDKTEFYNPYAKIFVAIVLLTAALFLCSNAIILAVFDYGKKTTNNFNSYTLTPSNADVLKKFKESFRVYIVYACITVFFLVYSHTEGITRQIMFNIGGALLSIVLLIASIYGCVASVRFLRTKQKNRQLYQ